MEQRRKTLLGLLAVITAIVVIICAVVLIKGKKTTEENVVKGEEVSIAQPNILINTPEWTNGQLEVEIKGEGEIQYKIGETGAWTQYTGKFVVEENTNIYARSVNGEEKGEEVKMVVSNIDKTAPTITVTPASSTAGKATTVTIIVGNEEGGSNLSSNNKYEYKMGSKDTIATGEWTKYESGKSITIGEGLTGTRYLWIKEIKDEAGNSSISQNGQKIGGYHVFGGYVFDSVAEVKPEKPANTEENEEPKT